MPILLIYIPFIVALAFLDSPVISFCISWVSSVGLIALVFNGTLKPRHYDGKWTDHPLRPLFIPHLIFAGYMCLTSVFFFWSLFGYQYFDYTGSVAAPETIERTVYAQSLYYLGHAGLVHGLLMSSTYNPSPNQVRGTSITDLSLRLTIVFTIITIGLKFFPPLRQFYERIANLGSVSASIALALAIPERKSIGLLIALAFFGLNFYQALLSGWKENILVSIILVGAFLIPVYRGKVIIFLVPVLAGLLLVLPTYNKVFRTNAWQKNTTQEIAFKTALNAVQQQQSLSGTNWEFLTERFSEIGMFIAYIKSVPERIPFYEFKIVEQGVESLVPRLLFPDKPITEDIVMSRVKENGAIAYESQNVSAKPPLVVDGYLSFGAWGALLFCFVFGWSAGKISVWAEHLFGGYFLGTGIIFTGLFPFYWRGNCVEFLFSSIFWSCVIMLAINIIFVNLKIIKRI